MSMSNARSVTQDGIPDGTRGPSDDFFCHKYQVWYRIEDCVYRGTNRTYSGCVNCFQGRLNMRSVAKGVKPPETGSSGSLLHFAAPRGTPD